eukprot:91443-Alexandrium_andersonii.AAC.1
MAHRATGEVVISLGDVGSVLVLAWSLRHHTGPFGNAYTLEHEDTKGCLRYLPVLDWDTWEVVPSKVISPLHAECFRLGAASTLPPGLAVWGTSSPVHPLENGGHHCFWQLPMTMIKKIMRAEGLVVPRTMTDYACM